MKQVIDEKVYDTETATRLGYCQKSDYGLPVEIWEELYQSPKGQYFVHRTIIGDGDLLDYWPDALAEAGIHLYSDKQAESWGEKHLNAEKAQELFGIVQG